MPTSDQLSIKDLELYKQIARKLAETGGAVLKEFWGSLFSIKDKGVAGDLVTEADQESEKQILDLLRRLCPTHDVLAEESGKHSTEASDFLWVIDPLDGTTNYAHQLPIVSVSVALIFRNQLVVGVVLNPLLDECFQAVVGGGATLNNHPIHVSGVKQLERSLLATGFPYDRLQTTDNNYVEFCRFTDRSQGVRRLGSAALDLAYVAAGRFDGYWERGCKAWDNAAGVLLVQEAGGKVTTYDGSPFDLYGERVLATNGWLHESMSEVLIKEVCNKKLHTS